MKHLKKLIAAALTMFVAFAVGTVALAANGKITIKNAAKGETYTLYKVMDATINASGGIDYVAIPEGLEDYLEEVTVNKDGRTYTAIGKKSTVSDEDFAEALDNFTKNKAADATQVATGNTVVFTVAPGYYVVRSTQGTNVMIDSATNPSSVINEKNSKTITAKKESDKASYSIGETITYTATFGTSNYYGEGDNGKVVTKYEITDTLPEFLSNVSVTSITIGGQDYKVNNETPQFDADKKITIPWATKGEGENAEWESIYANGSQIVVTYTAKLTALSNVNADNTNTIKIQPVVGDNDEKPSNDEWEKETVIKTYAAALKKVDAAGSPLTGAQFSFKGLTVSGSNGIYTVTAYDPTSDVYSDALATDDNGMLYIVGLASDVKLTAKEEVAPEGYNKLTSTVEVPAQVMSMEIYKESGTRYYDAKGNLVSEQSTANSNKTVEKNLSELDETSFKVINNQGTTLPSTGGIGTTIFYIVGGIMVVAAGVLLVTKKRVANN